MWIRVAGTPKPAASRVSPAGPRSKAPAPKPSAGYPGSRRLGYRPLRPHPLPYESVLRRGTRVHCGAPAVGSARRLGTGHQPYKSRGHQPYEVRAPALPGTGGQPYPPMPVKRAVEAVNDTEAAGKEVGNHFHSRRPACSVSGCSQPPTLILAALWWVGRDPLNTVSASPWLPTKKVYPPSDVTGRARTLVPRRFGSQPGPLPSPHRSGRSPP